MSAVIDSEAPVTPLNIYQRLNEVRKQVEYLQKLKKVEGQNYMAITHDQVTGAVREFLIQQGIMVVPNLVSSRMIDTGTTTAKGIPFMRYEATYRIAFVNVDTPAESVSVEMEAHALDHGDKAPGKAISYATKYAFLKLLSIETGEQEEEREVAKPAEKIEKPLPRFLTPPNKTKDYTIAPERASVLIVAARAAWDRFDAGDPEGAYDEVSGITDVEEKLYLWSAIHQHSALRASLKKQAQAQTVTA